MSTKLGRKIKSKSSNIKTEELIEKINNTHLKLNLNDSSSETIVSEDEKETSSETIVSEDEKETSSETNLSEDEKETSSETIVIEDEKETSSETNLSEDEKETSSETNVTENKDVKPKKNRNNLSKTLCGEALVTKPGLTCTYQAYEEYNWKCKKHYNIELKVKNDTINTKPNKEKTSKKRNKKLENPIENE
jgi:hypothetical protein